MEIKTLEQKILEKLVLESIIEQRRARRWKIFFRFTWLIIIALILIIAFADRSDVGSGGKQVAVINLDGAISQENKTYDTISKGLQDAMENKDVIAVVIKANSPGGSPVYSNMLYDEIKRLRAKYPKKPIDVVVEEVCASGCYYIAAAANNIYANQASIVGSIGVIYTGFGLTGLIDKIGVDNRLLISGRDKAMGYPFTPVNAEQQKMQQQMLDEIHQQFITAVKDGRGKRLANESGVFTGRYWIGQDAKTLGLIDGYQTVDSLARDVYKTDNIVDYTPDSDPMEKIAKKFGVEIVDGAKQAINSAEFASFK